MSAGQFLHVFPTPGFLRMPTAGLDIKDRTARFVKLREDRGSYRLAGYDEREIPDDVIVNGSIQARAQLIEILSDLREANDLEFVRVALPEEKSYLYHTTVPYVTDQDELREAVEYTIEGNVPLPYEEIVFDYRLLATDEPKEGDHVDVVVSVLPAKVVNAYLEVLHESGLRPMALMVESQAIARAVVPQDDPDSMMILNVGNNKTSVYLISRNAVHFTSTFSTKGGSVASPASEGDGAFAFNADEAVNQLEAVDEAGEKTASKEPSDTDEINTEETKEADTIDADAIIPSIVKEVKRVRGYWQSHGVAAGKNDTLRKVVICGNHAYNEQFTQKLAGKLELPVETADVWGNAFSLEEYVPPIRADRAVHYAAAIGLALPIK